jgi:hypothetical protein
MLNCSTGNETCHSCCVSINSMVSREGTTSCNIQTLWLYHRHSSGSSKILSCILLGVNNSPAPDFSFSNNCVIFCSSDSITSSTSTAPYDLEVLYKILDITMNLESELLVQMRLTKASIFA